MKEYRIVCTLEKENLYSEEKKRIENSNVWFNGSGHDLQTTDLDIAKRLFEYARIECGKYDTETRRRGRLGGIIYTQSNFRIQTREVSEWVDLKIECDTCKHGYFGDDKCNNCRVRYPSHYEMRTDESE